MSDPPEPPKGFRVVLITRSASGQDEQNLAGSCQFGPGGPPDRLSLNKILEMIFTLTKGALSQDEEWVLAAVEGRKKYPLVTDEAVGQFFKQVGSCLSAGGGGVRTFYQQCVRGVRTVRALHSD